MLFMILLGLLGSSGIWLLLLVSPWLATAGQAFSGTIPGRILLLFISLAGFAVISGFFLLAIWIAPKWFPRDKSQEPNE